MQNDNINSGSHFVPVEPFDLIVFGAAGDLSLRKLIPSLFHRWMDGQIPATSKIIGVSRSELSHKEFRAIAFSSFKNFHPSAEIDETDWSKFADHIYYVTLDAVSDGADWSGLSELLADSGDKQRVFYLALAPSLYGAVSANIKRAELKMTAPGSFSKNQSARI
ncbi:MAG: hypothetical protein KJN99_07920, partial [Marinicaulis sp.]|nr:hypothetical protein [Marinicaulis sp.]